MKKIVGDKIHMDPYKHRLITCLDNSLKVVGTISLQIETKAKTTKETTFHIIETKQPGLLGLTASQDLGFIKVVMTAERTNTPEQPRKMETIDKPPQDGKEDFIKKYPSVFTGLGRLDKPYHITIDPIVKSVVNPVRTVPAALREKVEAELEDMEKQGVIRRIGSTQWP